MEDLVGDLTIGDITTGGLIISLGEVTHGGLDAGVFGEILIGIHTIIFMVSEADL
mgnify:CR=1 FL=1